MKLPTISLCIIVRDDAKNLDACLRSVAGHVDEIIVVDTGSTDDSIAVATRHGAHVHEFSPRNHPEAFFRDTEEECKKFGAPAPYSGMWCLGDFSAPRNESFKHATKDFVVWIDSDDVLEGAELLRDRVAEIAGRNLGFGMFPYNYAVDGAGRVFYRQYRERIFRRGTASWHEPVHEVLMATGPIGPPIRYEQPLWVHRRKPDRIGVPNRNYKILLRQVWQLKQRDEKAQINPRTLFYLGQEARFIDPRRAAGFYEEYLQSSGWPEERASAHIALGTMLELGVLGMPQENALAQANREYATAAAEFPDNPDGLFGLARVAYLRKRFPDCVRYTERGFAMNNPESMLGANPIDRLYRPHLFYNHALAEIGRLEDALKSCEAGLAVMPDDPGAPLARPGMLIHNAQELRRAIEAKKNGTPPQSAQTPMVEFDKNEDPDSPPAHGIPRDALVIWSLQLWKQIVAVGDYDRARAFLQSLPKQVTEDPVYGRLIASTERRASGRSVVLQAANGGPLPEKLDVVIFTGPAPEPWGPDTPNKVGLGGSETAAIEMAKNLAALGHRVRIYGDPPALALKTGGVEYIHHSSFRGASCDVFISSRIPSVADAPIEARLKLLWVHDIHVGPPSPQMEGWLWKFDRILCLSEWHRGFFLHTYPTVHEDQVLVTRNGIDPERFLAPQGMPRKRNLMVFSSSPNRGLPVLLWNFREIRRRVPDAELEIYYGFDTWETMARKSGAQDQLEEIARYRAMIREAEREHGGAVRWRGKQPQNVLADAFLRAKVWGYLTDFPETSCISAMEAMAAGCAPVCSRWAALEETVGRHGILIDNVPGSGRRFVEEVCRMMTDEPARAAIGEEARRYALNNLSWASLASAWVEMFRRVHESSKANPIPLWKSA